MPYIRALVEVSALTASAVVWFLVDTGADVTGLNPQDGLRLSPSEGWKALSTPIPFGGAGAGLNHYPLPASLFFVHDDKRVESVGAHVYFATPDPANVAIESLLGRDVLGNFVMTFDQSAEVLTLA